MIVRGCGEYGVVRERKWGSSEYRVVCVCVMSDSWLNYSGVGDENGGYRGYDVVKFVVMMKDVKKVIVKGKSRKK